MSQQEIAGIIKRIEELVIEAAHRGVSEDEIMKAVNDGKLVRDVDRRSQRWPRPRARPR